MPSDFDSYHTKSLGMKLAYIPAGEFLMGLAASEENRINRARQHRVRITKPFFLGVFPVTQAQYKEVTGMNPSHFRGDNLAVEMVTWEDAVDFCHELSSKEGTTYRLPTEAEWEFACRAGTTTPHHFGSVLNGKQANCDGRHPYGTETKGPYLGRTSDVGSYAPNAWGLHDMHGNVWEWCRDWYDKDYYWQSPVDDPAGPKLGSYRVRRGGSWDSNARFCGAATRSNYAPDRCRNYLGFRIARDSAD